MKPVIIIAIAVVLLIPVSAYATTSVEKIMSDYRLKGDAYDELGYSYMAFLNYDKANWQQGKDNSYNEWMEYKTYVEENEKYFGGNYETIIPRAFSIGDFEGILIYSELAEKNFPEDGSRYGERVIALNFLGKFEEAKILAEQGRQLIVNPDNAEGSWFDIYGKMINFYKNAQYKQVINEFELWLDSPTKAYLDSQGISASSDMPFLVGLAYDKMGQSTNAEYYYDQVSYLKYLEPDCLLANRNFSWQSYNEVIKIMESGDNLETCHQKALYDYVVSKDIVIGQYYPPIQRTSLNEQETCADFIFGKYTDIEDYSLISELASQGLTEKNLDTSEVLLEYKGNAQYNNECQTLFKNYKQIGEESKDWKKSCSFLGEFPNANQVLEMYYVVDGVCRYADLSSVAQSVEESAPELQQESEIVCGTGTVEKDGICVPDYPDTEPSSRGGGCLIATATFGSELAPQVQQLRELRDNSLLQTESGTSFMNTFNDFYYSFSPYIADYERKNPVFREMVKIAITPMITSLSILNYVDMDSESEVLGYGISLILLNVGMYIGIPAIVIMRIRK